MIKGKQLYKIHNHCSKLRDLCHSTVNRALDTTKEHSHCNEELCKFIKCCVVCEKLCDCICCCCCNSECVGSGMMSEYKSQCKKMIQCCEKLVKALPKDKSSYLHCNKFINMCKQHHSTTKKHHNKKKRTTKRRYRK